MPNPGGQNQFQRESPYGAVKKLTQLTRAAPISGAPTPAMNAPQRMQRQAVRGRRAQPQSAAAPPGAAPPPQVSYNAQIAEIWRMLSGETDDPLVHEYAARAISQT